MQPKKYLTIIVINLGIFIASGSLSQAQSTESPYTNKLEKLEKENQDLRHRLDALEDMAKKEGLLRSGSNTDPPVSAMSEITLSGFVTASSFHDSSEPPASIGHKSPNPNHGMLTTDYGPLTTDPTPRTTLSTTNY